MAAKAQIHIVKVQVPIVTNAHPPNALVYNEDRSVQDEFPIRPALIRSMRGELKAFFYARLVPNKKPKGTFTIELQKPAPWQEW